MDGIEEQPPRGLRRLLTVSRVAAALAVAMGAVVLLGWALHNDTLKGNLVAGLNIKTNTGLGILLSGAALFLLAGDHLRPPRTIAGRSAAGVVLLIGLLTFSEHLLHYNLGIDELLFAEPTGAVATTSPNRMGPPAAVCFSLLGIGLLLLPVGAGRRQTRCDAVTILMAVLGIITTISVTGYLFGANELYDVGHLSAIALPTTLIIMTLSIGVACAARESRLMTLLTSPTAGGMLTRRLIPPAIALPPLMGYLCALGDHARLYDVEMGRALVVVSLIVLLVIFIWAAAKQLESSDLARQKATAGQRASETARHESESRFVLLADTISQLAWMARPDGHLFWYNRRWHDYCGTTPQQMEGWGWTSVHDPEHLPHAVESWKKALASGEPWEDTFPLRRHDGQMRWHLSRAMPLKGGNGKVMFWFGTNTDITDARNNAEALRQSEERYKQLAERERQARTEAERAGQMKDEFLATLSHELRTPLTAIMGWAQILNRSDRDPSDLAEGLSVIERNARVQAQLVEDLLDMSRIVSGKLRLEVRELRLSEVIDAAIESVRHAADAKEIQLRKHVDPTLAPVRGDAARLQQVIWNLLANAVKFTPRGGAIDVSVHRRENHVEIAVKDNGIGIKREFLPHVFERFRQADGSTTRNHAGLGLGLSIVKSLTELHGGRVRAHSDGEGQGATFIVELPVAAARESIPAAENDSPRLAAHSSPEVCQPEALRGVTVLVVDDEVDARQLVSRVLRQCAATVLLAASAAEAMQLIQQSPPDVILSDIGMAVEDGYDLIRAVRELPPSGGGATPAAALTAFARSEDRTRALRAGYQAHLAKPVEPAELVALVISLAARTLKTTHAD